MADTTRKLPVWRTALDAYRLIFQNLGFLLTSGLPWLVAAVFAVALIEWLLPADADTLISWRYVLQALLQSGAMALFLAPLAVIWHRRVLLGAHDGLFPPLALIAAYALTALVLEQAFSAMVHLLLWTMPPDGDQPDQTAVAVAAFVVVIIAALYLWSRVTLVLPAIALGHDSKVSTIWQETRGNGWRLAFSSLLAYFVLILPIGIYALTGSLFRTAEGAPTEAPTPTFVDALASASLYVAGAMIALSFLTVAYRVLMMRPNGAAPRANAPQPPAGDGS